MVRDSPWRCCGCCTGCRWRCRRRSAAASGALLLRVGGSRRRIARRNLELCLPEPDARPSARRCCASTSSWLGAQPARARAALVRQPGAAEAADPRRRRRRPGRAQRAAGDVAGAALHGAGRGRRRDAAVPDATGRLDLPGAEQSGVRRRDAPRPAALRRRRGLLAPRQGALPLVRAIRKRRHGLLQPAGHGLRRAATPSSCPSSACRRRRCWRRRAWRAR